jgi:hypothetical protein
MLRHPPVAGYFILPIVWHNNLYIFYINRFMKKLLSVVAAIFIITAGLFAFRGTFVGSIKGIVVPTDGASAAWAVSATDTFKTSVIQGAFEIAGVKPGTYRVLIQAVAPYKSTFKENVLVAEGVAADAGTFLLNK